MSGKRMLEIIKQSKRNININIPTREKICHESRSSSTTGNSTSSLPPTIPQDTAQGNNIFIPTVVGNVNQIPPL